MNFERLIPFVMWVVIGAAFVGKLDEFQRWVLKAQVQLLYEARASNWGSPRVFK